MTPAWDGVTTRARGLGTHFLSRAQLGALAGAPDTATLAAALRRDGVLTGTPTDAPNAEAVELGIRRWAAGMLRILTHWTGTRAAVLPLVFDDEDRRSLQVIFRGAAQRTAAERRLAGLIPTPSLPEGALDALARAPTAGAAAALLAIWRHPLAAAIAPAARTAQPDLFALESALAQALAARATAAAAHAHSRALRDAVREAIDLDNARTAMVLATTGRDVVDRDQFLPGGARLSLDTFATAIATGDSLAAGTRLAPAFAGTGYAAVLREPDADAGSLEDRLLRVRLGELTRRLRRAPLGPLVLVWFALRLRAQLLDLQRILWSVALGAPGQAIDPLLVTAAP